MVILESFSKSNELGRSQVLEFGYLLGGRNTEEKYSLKIVAFSIADSAVTPLNVIS